MTSMISQTIPQSEATESRWAAVWVTALGVASLTAADMLPVSLLTPMAADLGVSEGTAGQSVTATAVIALITSFFIAVVTGSLDRRRLLLGLSIIQMLLNLIVAVAPNLPALLVGRMLLVSRSAASEHCRHPWLYA